MILYIKFFKNNSTFFLKKKKKGILQIINEKSIGTQLNKNPAYARRDLIRISFDARIDYRGQLFSTVSPSNRASS